MTSTLKHRIAVAKKEEEASKIAKKKKQKEQEQEQAQNGNDLSDMVEQTTSATGVKTSSADVTKSAAEETTAGGATTVAWEPQTNVDAIAIAAQVEIDFCRMCAYVMFLLLVFGCP